MTDDIETKKAKEMLSLMRSAEDLLDCINRCRGIGEFVPKFLRYIPSLEKLLADVKQALRTYQQ